MKAREKFEKWYEENKHNFEHDKLPKGGGRILPDDVAAYVLEKWEKY